jgi:hypothetical protein
LRQSGGLLSGRWVHLLIERLAPFASGSRAL